LAVTLRNRGYCGISPPPAVNRLVRVTRRADIVVRGGECLGDSILCVVGILVFINKKIFIAISEFLANTVVFEQKGRFISKSSKSTALKSLRIC